MNSEPRRKRLRLSDFAYSDHHAYFVTICTQGRLCLFGEVAGENVELNAAGLMVEKWWSEFEPKYPRVEVGEFVVMPNHVHGIVWILGKDALRVAEPIVQPGQPSTEAANEASLPRMMQWFKTMTTNAYIRGVKAEGWPAFKEKLWQRSYHERVIRNDRELNGIRQYILDNPRLWAEDEENPERARGS